MSDIQTTLITQINKFEPHPNKCLDSLQVTYFTTLSDHHNIFKMSSVLNGRTRLPCVVGHSLYDCAASLSHHGLGILYKVVNQHRPCSLFIIVAHVIIYHIAKIQ